MGRPLAGLRSSPHITTTAVHRRGSLWSSHQPRAAYIPHLAGVVVRAGWRFSRRSLHTPMSSARAPFWGRRGLPPAQCSPLFSPFGVAQCLRVECPPAGGTTILAPVVVVLLGGAAHTRPAYVAAPAGQHSRPQAAVFGFSPHGRVAPPQPPGPRGVPLHSPLRGAKVFHKKKRTKRKRGAVSTSRPAFLLYITHLFSRVNTPIYSVGMACRHARLLIICCTQYHSPVEYLCISPQ